MTGGLTAETLTEPFRPTPTHFSHGIAWLASYVHSLGLKLGIYTGIGTRTCQGLTGSAGHYQQDAQTFHDWGVDFVKVDECGGLPTGTTNAELISDFRQFGQDIRSYGMVYSEELPIFAGNANPSNAAYGPDVRASASFANMWRVAPDENPSLAAEDNTMGREGQKPKMPTDGTEAIIASLEDDTHLYGEAGPGHWNDLDMVLTGSTTFKWSTGEYESQLATWAMEASPLLIGSKPSALSKGYIDMLGNQYIIAIDQSGSQASHGLRRGSVQMLCKPVEIDGTEETAVLFANEGTKTASGSFPLAVAGIDGSSASEYIVWDRTSKIVPNLSYRLGAGNTYLVILK